jgi:hypothetical protein
LHIQLEVSPEREKRVIFWTFAFPLGYSLAVCLGLLVYDIEKDYEVVGGDKDSFGCYITKEFISARNIATYIPLVIAWLVTAYYYLKSQLRLSKVVASTRLSLLKDADVLEAAEAQVTAT